MSEKIFEKYGLHVTAYYGGEHRGRCFAIDVDGHPLELTNDEFFSAIRELLDIATFRFTNNG